jgi:hypothetical protein
MQGDRRRLSFLFAFAVEELKSRPPSLVEEALGTLMGLGVHHEPLFAAGIIARGDPPAGPAVELHHNPGHYGALLV